MVKISFTKERGCSSMTVVIEEDTANMVIGEVERLARVSLIPKGLYKPKEEEK